MTRSGGDGPGTIGAGATGARTTGARTTEAGPVGPGSVGPGSTGLGSAGVGATGPGSAGAGTTGPDPAGAGSTGPGSARRDVSRSGGDGPGSAGAGGGSGAMLTAAVAAGADDPAARARSLLVPVADPGPRAAAVPSVAPVLPGRPVADRPQVRTPGREPGTEGGAPCPWCATPNRPDRHFCVVCAMPLSGGPAVPGQRRPWWRRVRDFRNRETPWAGDRPRLRRGFGYLMTWVLWALVAALLITAVVYADNAVGAVRDHFAKRTPVGPDAVSASRSYPGHDPQLAFDKLNNTWWGPGISQSGAGEWVEARFDRPTRLLDVIITPGVSTRADRLSQSALPHHIEAVITTSDGKTTTRSLTLDQGAGGQRRTFRAGDVTAVRFILRSAYAAAADKQVAIAEVEFFGPSKSSRAS
ncbi:zinc ribbon domain-containing protein [Streptomyces sp. NPDC002054]|uniref:NADase-type glycan-binding domain-containing protein n=1 Tax=Streptomyces sp. NPDC002054 TaxID=3154663 RepID=UPI00332A81D7